MDLYRITLTHERHHCHDVCATPKLMILLKVCQTVIIKQNKVVVYTFPEDTPKTTKKLLSYLHSALGALYLYIHSLRLLVQTCVGAMSSSAISRATSAAANARQRLPGSETT